MLRSLFSGISGLRVNQVALDVTGNNIANANTVGFKSAEVDRIIRAEKTMATVAEREEAYREIDRLVAAECPYAFLWNIAAKRLVY